MTDGDDTAASEADSADAAADPGPTPVGVKLGSTRTVLQYVRDVECTAADRPDLAPAEGARRIAERLLE
jgi:hypothetical protein